MGWHRQPLYMCRLFPEMLASRQSSLVGSMVLIVFLYILPAHTLAALLPFTPDGGTCSQPL